MGKPPYPPPNSFQGVAPTDVANGTVVHASYRGLEEPCEKNGQGNGGNVPGLAHESVETPLARFVHSGRFQNTTLAVIVVNAAWLSIDVEYNHPNLEKNGKLPLEPVSIIVENAFCLYFTFEIVVRVFAFGKHNLTDPTLNRWFVFDSVLVTFMVVETWILLLVQALVGGGGGDILSKFSCLRLMRLTRLTRIMHSLPELLTLVRGMINAARAVGTVLMFMILLMYVFAIVFTAQIGDPDAPEHKEEDPYWVRDSDPTAPELFGSMIDSMMTLFTRGLLGDNLAETLQAIKDRGGTYSCEGEGDEKECGRTGGDLWLMWVFVVFMIISAFCLLNMLVGVLCEVIEETAKSEDEASQISNLRYNIQQSFMKIDESGDGKIKKLEWSSMRESVDVRSSFARIGVEEEFMEERLDQIEEHLFGRLDKNRILEMQGSWMPDEQTKDESGIPLEEFVQHILEIRPDMPASFLDLEILRTRAERDEAQYIAQLDKIEEMVLKKFNRTVDSNGYTPAPVKDRDPEAPLQLPIAPVTDRDGPSIDLTGDRKTEEPNNGTSAPDGWILGLPTEVLFAELKHRATLQHNSSLPPAMDVD